MPPSISKSLKQSISEQIDPADIRNDLGLYPSIKILRWIGYGFLLLTGLQWLNFFYPLNFMNASWEFQLLRQVVESIPLPLLGFALVFWGGQQQRSKWESTVLRLLSSSSLCIGLILLLFIPLGIANTSRLNQQLKVQADVRFDRQIAYIQNLDSQINQADSLKELNNLRMILLRQNSTLKVAPFQELQQGKEKLYGVLQQTLGTLRSQHQAAESKQSLILLKQSIQANLGALIAGTLFIMIWSTTRWTKV